MVKSVKLVGYLLTRTHVWEHSGSGEVSKTCRLPADSYTRVGVVKSVKLVGYLLTRTHVWERSGSGGISKTCRLPTDSYTHMGA